MKNFFTILLTMSLLLVCSANAEIGYSMPALEVGFKLNTMDVDSATSNKQSQAFQAGGSIVFDLGSSDSRDFGIKTGLFYSERTYKNEFSSTAFEGKISYAEIPLQIMFKFEDYAGIYFGPSFATKLSDECTGTACTTSGVVKPSSSIMPLTFGAQFKMFPNLGLSLFFETISSDISSNLKNSRAIGANLLLVFD